MKKRKLTSLLILLAIAALVVAACGGSSGGGKSGNGNSGSLPETDKVVIGVYGGAWEENIRQAALDQFQAETGIKVEIVAGADAEWFTKVRAANGKNPPYDLLILQPDTIQRALAADLLQPIDPEHVPNLADLYPSIQARFTVDGKQYAAGFSMGQLGIAYRKDLIPFEPKRWLDLWNPQLKDRVAISSPSYSAGLQFFAGLTHALGGELRNEADVDRTFEKLAEMKDLAAAFPDNPGTIQTLLERGDVWAVPFWDGRVFALQQSGLENIAFVYPEDGPVAAVASWAIMKGSPNLANAYKLLNYLSSPEVHRSFSDLSLYGMSNKNVQYSDELKDKVQVGEEFYQKLIWVDYDTATPKLADWTNRWTQVLGGGQ